jgi:hypothetical protein
MRDKLKQRLFDLGYDTGSKTPSEAITYIEELELELYEMNELYGSVKDGLEEKLAEALAVAKIWQEDFIEENKRWGDALLKLDKAVEYLRKIAAYTHIGTHEQGIVQNAEARIACTALAELETEPLGAEFEAVWDANKGELYEP